ncbi:hypothetical protein WMY93_030550 [Mugilogobius chulae]|uniref:Uncharacterized protein n=1 Tax=Mugilogobius chulae TaxID=88201 RepID=A0AAW0MLW0_9GOBI
MLTVKRQELMRLKGEGLWGCDNKDFGLHSSRFRRSCSCDYPSHVSSGRSSVTYNLEEGLVPETNLPVRFYLKPNRSDGSASVLVAENLDYETTRFFTLRVRVQNVAAVPLASFTTVYVNVTDSAYVRVFVADVNDNAPRFEKPVYEVSVEEDQEVGFGLITVTATDQDEGANAKLRYQLSSGPGLGWFDVDPQVGRVFVAQRLDFETRQRLELKLLASDGKWANETLLIINILNRNDEAPVFSQALYQASVQEESASLPLLLLQVSAVDPDLDSDQSQLRYSLHGQGSEGEFTIDPETGSIHALRRLDREERPLWRFLVLATDEAGAGLTGFADVLLEVSDINDNAPFFPCAALQEDGCFVGRVAENSPADTSVMEMRAVDLDDPNEGNNAALTYSIVQNVKNEINLNLFNINASTGTISTVVRSLDREQQQRLLVVVEARDGGGLTGTGTATILVTDVNDHPPVFTQDSYSAQISEDLEVNSQVLLVSATDADLGENAAVTFSIVDGDEERKFFIETNKTSQRGVLRLKKKIDFERLNERSFNLTLKAEDADFYSLTHALIQVRDANDNAPVFLPQFYEAPATSEDSPVGTVIAQVTASDLDSGQNGRFSFSISKDSDPHGQFSVDASGFVVLADSLDREKIWQHRIVVLATDLGKPMLTGTAIVSLTVLDVNDNAPEFDADYRPIVWENTAAPQTVKMNGSSALLHVKDRDASGNAAPFSIRMLQLTADAASFNLTDLGNGSAVLTALRTFDRERQKEYRVPVLLQDSGSPPLSSTQTLTVTIGDRNDNPHEPGHTAFILYSYDGLLPETVLGKVQAPDPDDWGQKQYSLQGNPPSFFSLNRSSGHLVSVEVRELNPEAVRSAAAITLHNVSQAQFFGPVLELSLFSRLSGALSDLLQLPPGHVHIFSLAEASVSGQTSLTLWLCAHGESYYRPERILGYVSAYKDKLQSSLGVSLSPLDLCSHSNCSDSGGCSTQVDFGLDPVPLGSGSVVLVSVKPSVRSKCGCRSRELTHRSCSSYPTNPCLNGGSCYDGPLGFRCRCPPLLDGPRCEQTRISFGGAGFSWFPPLSLCSVSLVSLEFLSESSTGLLLYQGPLTPLTQAQGEDQAFIALELIEGVPVLSLNLGSDTLTLALPSESAVRDRRWHRLDVLLQGESVELTLDQCSSSSGDSSCRVNGKLTGQNRRMDVWRPLQVGGVKNFSPLHRYRSFSGCIRNLVVNSQVYDFASPGDSLDSYPGCRLTDGVCLTAAGPSCGEHASCLSQWGSFSCDCHPGFTGHKCDTVVPEFSFDGYSVVRLQPRGSADPRRTSIQLLLRTREEQGPILSVESRDGSMFLSVELTDGLLSVRSDLGSGPQTLVLPGLRVNLGEWIYAELQRYDSDITLSLEGGGGDREVHSRLEGGGGDREVHSRMEGGEVELSQITVTVGGAREGNKTTGFQGCLRDVRFNGLLLPLDGRGLEGRSLEGRGSEGVSVLENRGVSSGCRSESCRSAKCSGPLRCVDLWRKHECRCPGSQMLLSDSSGRQRCVPSPCRPSSCRHGAVCQPLSAEHFLCRCPEGVKGHRCELGSLRGHLTSALSPSSILAISMCLLVFLGVLVAVTVWNQKGSRSKFRKRGVYHVPTEHESWEDIRENILNYNEEGGGEQDQNGYDISELKRPLCSSLSQSSSCTTAPLLHSSPGSQEEVHCGAPYRPHQLQTVYASLRSEQPESQGWTRVYRTNLDFRSYVSRIVWEADHHGSAFPPDSLHVWSVEGSGSSAGSLSSLGSAIEAVERERRGGERGRGGGEEEESRFS